MINRRVYRYTRYFVLIGLVIAVIVVTIMAFKTVRFFRNIGVVVTEKIITRPKPTFTVALLGYGGGQHEGAYLTDTIIVAHLNYDTQKALLVSVPRDLWVKLPTKSGEPFAAKINTVYQLQLFPKTFPDVDVAKYTKNSDNGLMAKVLQDITGLTIDSYVAIDFEAFTKLIDILGGIDINLEKGFVDEEYPITGKENDLCGHEETELPELEKIATESVVLAFPCRYETISFQPGINHLDAETALKFSRSRHSLEDGGDFARAKRQQMVIEAVSEKLLSARFFPKIPQLMDELQSEIKTDASYSDITRLLKQAPFAKQYRLTKLILTTDNLLKTDFSSDGQYILIPKAGKFQWPKIQQKIRNLMIPKVTPKP